MDLQFWFSTAFLLVVSGFEDDSHDVCATIRARLADNADPWDKTTNRPSAPPLTSAGVGWDTSPWVLTGLATPSPDLSPVIQEIVHRAGWASGNAIGLIVVGVPTAENANRSFRTFEVDEPAKLIITFAPRTQ